MIRRQRHKTAPLSTLRNSSVPLLASAPVPAAAALTAARAAGSTYNSSSSDTETRPEEHNCFCTLPLDGERCEVQTRCHHRFHADCLERWVRSRPHGQRTCPMCRHNIVRIADLSTNTQIDTRNWSTNSMSSSSPSDSQIVSPRHDEELAPRDRRYYYAVN